ncbi:MAG TPA: hypothetical protein VL968_09755 [Rhodocyclaceae bacterium]|jgi:hypothetical protein|nr:hypothetical protein [Rhodocyclaceae bacterium]
MWTNLIPAEQAPSRALNVETVELSHEDKVQLEDQIKLQVSHGWVVKSRSHTADGSHTAILFRKKAAA